MNGQHHTPPLAVRLAWLTTAACATIAIAALPATMVPPIWRFAFLLPGVVLGLLPGLARSPWWRTLLAIVLQVSTCALALQLEGPVTQPAALACTILPPLGFAAARGNDADRSLALFLSFCMLLVGAILAGQQLPWIAAWAIAACCALRAQSHLAARSVGNLATARARVPLRQGALAALGSMLLGGLCAALAVDRTLGWLPSPSSFATSRAKAEPTATRRSPGLDDSFVLDGGGALAGLGGELLARVRDLDGTNVPPDLYLRSGFFARPGMDKWQHGNVELLPQLASGDIELREPLPRLPTTRFLVERFAGGRNFVFVTPHTLSVHGLDGLAIDPNRLWLRPTDGTSPEPYELRCQPLPVLGRDAPLAYDARELGLLTLPRALERERWERLLAEWNVPEDPFAAMEAIAAGLARHCRYDRLTEPSGPFAYEVENFLFADGEHRGYCMHFASAAALLLRLRGVPCRLGVGLHGGQPSDQEPGVRIYGSQHAHAWVEVPFDGLGYVVFDPTPPSERGNPMPARVDSEPDAAPTERSALQGWLDDLRAQLSRPYVPAIVLLLTLALALRPLRRGRADAPAQALASPIRRARRLLAQLLKQLATAGHPRHRGETLEAFARTLRRAQVLEPAIAAAFTAYQDVRFGGHEFDAARQRALQHGLAAATDLATLAKAQPPAAST